MAAEERRSGGACEVEIGDKLWFPAGDGEYAVRTVVYRRKCRPAFDKIDGMVYLWFAEVPGRRFSGEEGQTVYWATEADIAAAPVRTKPAVKR